MSVTGAGLIIERPGALEAIVLFLEHFLTASISNIVFRRAIFLYTRYPTVNVTFCVCVCVCVSASLGPPRSS